MHSPLAIARNYVEIGKHKVRLSAFKMVILGIFAGMFIGFAGVASTTGGATIENPSVSRLISAFLFPAGLMMVLIAGSELFTGNNLIILAVLEKKVKIGEMLKNWFWVFLGNFVGATFVALLVVYGHVPDLFGGNLADVMVKTAVSKVQLSFSDAIIKGILCNILVCIAVWAAFAAKQVSGKIVMSFFPIAVFVLCGFEHCIGNVYTCMAGIFTAAEYGIAAEGLTFGSFLLKNLLPVTIGNTIGGAGIVGVGYWLMYLRHTPLYALPVEVEQKEIELAEEYYPFKQEEK